MNRPDDFPYLPKDFIETAEGLIFAVVSYGPQAGKVGCFLRYVKSDSGWQKIATEAANRLLTTQYPHYLYHSEQFDAAFHAVDIEYITQHYHPEQRLKDLLDVDVKVIMTGTAIERALAGYDVDTIIKWSYFDMLLLKVWVLLLEV